MNFDMVMQELESLGKERLKKMYLSYGAREPLFGVATGEMKPILKKTKLNQPLAEQLYATGNYDAMYFAGIIAEPNSMTEADYDRWLDSAYFYMLSDYVVAVTLSEADIAQDVADKWIASGEDLRMSAGWSCYCWLLGSRPDREFSESKLTHMLEQVEHTIHNAPERTKYAMNNFIYTVATSYLPLHDQAVAAAEAVGPVEVNSDKGKSKHINALVNIQKFLQRRKLGFKRKHVRC
ncbi:DNA alkylation repair protein [Paenibacillus gansuensis]|uniref:DNA alkylation repair protein n=1 Tax=Paenibacillus gansuensis TaxID=306542 RepID=A0ABW5PHZ2_9BACL